MTANNLEQQAQDVWTEKNISKKKELLHEMITSFRYKAKQEQFRDIVDGTTRAARLDRLAADLMLADTDKVIRS